MPNKLTFAFLASFIFISCSNKHRSENEIYYKNFDNLINIKNSLVSINTPFLFKPSHVSIIDSILVVQDFRNMEKVIHFFNKNNFKYIGAAGIVGKGPGEIEHIASIYADSKKNCLWATDMGKRVLWKFPLDSVIKNTKYKPTEYISFPQGIGGLLKVSFINDSVLFANALIGGKGKTRVEMIEFNYKLGIYRKCKSINSKPISFPDLESSSFDIATSEDGKNTVKAYIFSDLFEIIDENRNLKYSIYGPLGITENTKYLCFQKIGICDSLIYALYLGEKIGGPADKILIFDVKGLYIKGYYSTGGFWDVVFDPENKRFVGYSLEKRSLVYFQINK